MNSFIKKKTTSTGIALLSIFGGSGGGIPAIKICRQSCKAIFVLLLLTLTGCKRSTDVEFDTVQKQSPNAPVLTQFSFTVDKGQVLTMDAAPYVNSDKSWQLTSVTDPKGLVSNISINGSSATMTADHAGVTALSWLITQEGKTYSSVFYLAVQDVSSSSTPPTAADIRRSTDSETSISIDLSQAVSDADGDTLTISMFAQSPDRFTLDGMDVTYTPSGYVGNDIAMYSVEDGSGGFAIGQISVIVNDANPPVPNTPPTADDHAVSLNQGESLDIDISTLVSDSDGDDVSLTKLIAASGRASITDAKTITYSSGSFSGLDSFVYIVSDGKGGIAQAEIQVTVNPVAVPPPLQTNPLVLSMTAGNTTVFDISSSVSSGLDWQLTAVNDPAGLVKVGIIASQSVTLTALSSGIARVSYTAETANESKSSELIISISEADTTPPKARNITLNTDNITPLSVNLSAYISGTDSDSLRVTKLLQANTRFKLSGSTVTYTPANFIGVDSAAYVVEDKRGGFAVGYISVVVKDANPPVPNTPPTAENHAVSLNQGESLDIDISTLVNDSDGDEVSLTKLIAASGRASITDAKTITYSSGSFSGLDSFVYIVSDGKGGIAQAEIQVTVHPVAVPAPLQVNPLVLSMTAGETRPFDISSSVSSGLDWQLSDVNDPTGLVKVGTIASPSVTLTALSSGIARVRYTAETANESKSSELIISISERDTTPPKAQNVTLETDNDTSVTVDLSAYISGADSDSLRVTKLLQTDERFVLSGSKVTYNPAGFIGVDSATYVVENERGGYGLGLIMVNVADANPPVPNNPPTAKGYTQTTDSDTSVSLDLSALKLIGD
uniref:Ig-like domain-containing protein n=1 Tax=Psychromonas ossibalaenae TaxID=444922 RepID=UPI00037C891C